jgi:hypothetical protein
LVTWSLKSDKQRLKEELERRKNEALIPHTIDEAIKQYKLETDWDRDTFRRENLMKRKNKH